MSFGRLKANCKVNQKLQSKSRHLPLMVIPGEVHKEDDDFSFKKSEKLKAGKSFMTPLFLLLKLKLLHRMS